MVLATGTREIPNACSKRMYCTARRVDRKASRKKAICACTNTRPAFVQRCWSFFCPSHRLPAHHDPSFYDRKLVEPLLERRVMKIYMFVEISVLRCLLTHMVTILAADFLSQIRCVCLFLILFCLSANFGAPNQLELLEAGRYMSRSVGYILCAFAAVRWLSLDRTRQIRN